MAAARHGPRWRRVRSHSLMPAHRKFDREAAFYFWFNDGALRSKNETAKHFGVNAETVRMAAIQDDWAGRAAKLEGRIRQRTDDKLVTTAADRREESLKLIDHVITLFVKRLIPFVPDSSGKMVPNPDALTPADISLLDLRELIKLRDAIEGGATAGTIDARQVNVVLGDLSNEELRALAQASKEHVLGEIAERVGLPAVAALEAAK
jgi:hypothetical protein